jgi:hypothetical protein
MIVADVVALIRKMKLDVDQVIDEYGQWVHVSHSKDNRNQYLKARRQGGETIYKKFS